MLGLVRPDGDNVIVGLGVRLGDVSEVCANDGNATRVAVTTTISELESLFIDAILSETGRRRQAEEAWSEDAKNGKRKSGKRKQASLPDSELAQLGCGKKGPIAICCRAGWTGMKNPAETDLSVRKGLFGAFKGKTPNSDEPFRLKDSDNIAQVFVASGEQRHALGGRQFVWSAIAPGALDKSERAIVHNNVFLEKPFGRAELFGEKSP